MTLASLVVSPLPSQMCVPGESHLPMDLTQALYLWGQHLVYCPCWCQCSGLRPNTNSTQEEYWAYPGSWGATNARLETL